TLLSFLVFSGIVALAGGFKNVDIPGLSATINFEGATNSGSMATAIYYVMFAYGGATNVNNILDEVHDPVRNLPRVGIFSLSITFVLYMLANVVYYGVLTRDEILGSSLTIAATFFSKLYGGTFGTRVLPFLISLSPLGFANTILFTNSRIVLEIARDGLLPFSNYIGWVEPRTNSPVFSIALIWVITAIFLWAPPPGDVFNFITTFSSYTGSIFDVLTVGGIFLLRSREKDLERPIKAPAIFLIFGVLFSIYQLIFSFVPPLSNSTAYVYYLPYVGSLILFFATIGYWYLQVVWYKGPEKSYNAQLAKEGLEAGTLEKIGAEDKKPSTEE
ncbi:hypothetical protein HK100_005926, partial [Physocladia obscura]